MKIRYMLIIGTNNFT